MKMLFCWVLVVFICACEDDHTLVKVYRDCIVKSGEPYVTCVKYTDELYVDYDRLRYQLIRKDKP